MSPVNCEKNTHKRKRENQELCRMIQDFLIKYTWIILAAKNRKATEETITMLIFPWKRKQKKKRAKNKQNEKINK